MGPRPPSNLLWAGAIQRLVWLALDHPCCGGFTAGPSLLAGNAAMHVD